MAEMVFVDSSNIESVGYDAETGELFVNFIESGNYVYFEVPLEVYDGLLAASSKGQYLNQFVKPRYGYQRL